MSSRFSIRWRRTPLVVVVTLVLGVAGPVLAQEEGDVIRPWSFEAELSLADTSGNTSSRTVAASGRFVYNLTFSELIVYGDVFRNESETRALFNEGGAVREETTSQTTADRYELGAAFRQNILNNLFWYVRGGWYRNEPAGMKSSLSAGGGVGYRFRETERTLVAGEVGVALTREELVSGTEDTFADGRALLEIRQQLSESADFRVSFEALQNLQDTDDLRMNAKAAITSNISSRFALRVGWDLKYDRQPATLLVSSVATEPPALFRFQTTDAAITAALVISF